MLRFYPFALFLFFQTAHALQCGTPGSAVEQRSLRTNKGLVMINGGPRYGARTFFESKHWGSCFSPTEDLAMFRYDPKQNVVALFHCVNGEVYFREADNINFACE